MTAAQSGTLAETVVAFVRTLRHAGLPLGPERTLRALEAVQAVGLERRDDFLLGITRHSDRPGGSAPGLRSVFQSVLAETRSC